MERACASDRMDKKYANFSTRPVLDTPWSFISAFEGADTLSRPPMSLRLARNMSFGRWLLVACFSSVKIRNVSGHHLFPNATTHAKKFLCPPRTVLHRAKKTLCNRSQFRTLFLPHRFIKIRPSHQRPVSVEFVTICGIPGSPNLSKIEKVAENRDFDGKETLIVKRAIAKSFGWKSSSSQNSF